MGDEKGKGRAHPKEDNSSNIPSDEKSQGASILSRVTASASGLSRNIFAAPNSRELNEGAAAALANSGKGQSTSSGSLTWAGSSRTLQPVPQGSGPTGNGFRIDHNEEHVRQSEDEFSSFLDGVDSLSSAPSDIVGIDNNAITSGGVSNGFGDVWTRSQVPERQPPPVGTQHRTILDQVNRDGEDVLAMLSKPGDLYGSFETPQENEEDYDWGLSPEQIIQLRAMTKDLFPLLETHSAISPDHPLNLVPAFEGNIMNRSGPQVDTHADESYMYFGIHSDPSEAREIWRDQWEGVLTRYADEVWGGLLPLVKEARKEVEDLPDDHSATDQPKALRRLGAILSHLRNHGPVAGQ